MKKTKLKQTEIGMIPEDWEVKELKEILANKGYIRGPFGSALRRPELKSEGIPVYEQQNAIYDHRIFRFFIDDKKHKELLRFTVQENDLIISCSGTFGKVSIIKKEDPKGIISQALLILRPDINKVNPNFLKYFFSSKVGYQSIASRSMGSVQVNIAKREIIEKIKLGIPIINEQAAIVKILSDLDSKIELLQKQNQTLEKIGQSLFKYWFIDFEFPNEEGKPYKSSGGEMVYNEELDKEIPKGWSIGCLGDLMGQIKDPLKAGESIKNRKYVPIDLLSMKMISILSYLPYNEAKSSLIGFQKDDILVGAMRVYFHRVNLAPFLGVTRATTFVLRPIKKELLSYSLLLLNQDETINYANAHSKGSTMPYAVWDGSLEKMACLIPQNDTIEEFHKLIYPMISKIRDSLFDIYSLSQIRDSLLPRLMSGKIRVPIEVRA